MRELEQSIGRGLLRVHGDRSCHKAPHQLTLLAFSPVLQYLTVVEAEARPALADSPTTVLELRAKSASALPAWIPFGIVPALVCQRACALFLRLL